MKTRSIMSRYFCEPLAAITDRMAPEEYDAVLAAKMRWLVRGFSISRHRRIKSDPVERCGHCEPARDHNELKQHATCLHNCNARSTKAIARHSNTFSREPEQSWRDHTMKCMRKVIGCALVVVTMVLPACDSRGRPFEDLRLARLNEGESSEQDVRKLFGEPAAVRDFTGGKGLIYPLGPEGPHTLLLKIDAKGKYQGREDLLTRVNFERVTRGMKELDVLVMLGRPVKTQKYPLKQRSAWEWRFVDGSDTRVFVVTFDATGTVVEMAVEDDRGRLGGQ